MATITETETRFPGIRVRCYRDVYRVGVPYDPPRPAKLCRPPFRDTWWRFACQDNGPGEPFHDRGPAFRSRDEAFAALADYADANGYPAA